MFSTQTSRRFLSFMLILLVLLSAGVYSPVRADEGEITPSPTLTPENSATPTETLVTPSPTWTLSLTPESQPETTLTPSPTPSPSTPTATSTPSLQLPTLHGDYVPDEVLVRFASLADGAQAMASACFANDQVEITGDLGAIGASILTIKQGSVAEIIALANQCPQIVLAEPNYTLHALDTFPNDPNWSQQYGLNAIRAPQGWDLDTGAATVVIAVIDTGVDLTHPDLMPKLVAGYDFVNHDAIPQDDNGHGTHVAGIAAAQSNNGTGVSGVSWGARIMPVKVLNASASGTFADAAAGIIWAADHGAQIINMSLGGSAHSQIFEDAVNYAYGKGVMLIASSGNNGSGFILYPARFVNVMAVGATDSSNVRANFSNYGAELDVVAPGVSIYSTGINSYYYNSGTSMSAPFVSGLAAILRGLPGSGSPANLAWAIKSTALDLGAPARDDYYGDGLIQMDAAIRLLLPTPTPTATPQPENPQPTAQTWIWQASMTPTASPTPTVTLTPTVFQTVSPFPTADADPTLAPPTEPELFALATSTQVVSEETHPFQRYFLLCLGSFLILLGLLLLLFAQRLRRSDKYDKNVK